LSCLGRGELGRGRFVALSGVVVEGREKDVGCSYYREFLHSHSQNKIPCAKIAGGGGLLWGLYSSCPTYYALRFVCSANYLSRFNCRYRGCRSGASSAIAPLAPSLDSRPHRQPAAPCFYPHISFILSLLCVFRNSGNVNIVLFLFSN
jgi:hypothetical protein